MLRIGLVIAIFAGLLGLWHCFDHSLPAPDDSSYILASFHYADLLRHPKFWKLDWWYNMLTVNRFYPPTSMIFNGVLRLLCGTGNWVNVLSVVIFNGILTATTYATTKILTNNSIAGIFAAILINLYPQTCVMNHGFALDAPLLSMISLGLFVLMWWKSSPSWNRTIVTGVALGLCCLTKQIAAAYLIGPGIFCLIDSLGKDWSNRQWQATSRLAVVALLTILVGLPWLLTNISVIHSFAQYNQSSMGRLPLWQVFQSDITFYLHSLPSIMSPLLLGAFLLALVLVKKNIHHGIFPVTLSAIVGVLLISTLTWSFPSLRYVAPVMILASIYTGCAMSSLVNKGILVTTITMSILFLAILQYISFNFAPYPITSPALSHLSEKLGVNVVETIGLTARDRRSSQLLHSKPQEQIDWGQEWALKTIDNFEGRKSVYMNILPDYVELNGNTFELLATILGSPVRPTTARKWTVMGDEVTFSPDTALYCQWYLLKSGCQGNLLRDDQSTKCYNQLTNFVTLSGKFRLIASHNLPDGSTMFLYRQK